MVDKSLNNPVKKDFPWNRNVLLSFEFMWGAGLPFSTYWVIVPAYMAVIGAPKTLIGIVTSLYTMLSPLQFIVAHHIGGKPKKKWLTLGYSTAYTPWFIYSLLMVLFPSLLTGIPRIAVFSFTMLILAALLTTTDSLYGSLIVENTPLTRRGSFYGYRLLAVSIGMGVSAFVEDYIMKKISTPTNYHLSFLIGTLLICIASLFPLLLREHVLHKPTVDMKIRPIRDRFIVRIRLLLRRVLKEPNYKITIFFILLIFASKELNPFVVTFTYDSLHITGSQVLIFSLLRLFSAAFFGIVIGKIGDKTGYRVVGILLGLSLSIAFVIVAITTQLSPPPIGLIYLGYSLNSGVSILTYMVLINLSVEILHNIETSNLIAISNIIILPAIAITQPLSGLIVDLTGSYFTVFTIGILLSGIGAFGFVFLVREPRKRRMYSIKTTYRRLS